MIDLRTGKWIIYFDDPNDVRKVMDHICGLGIDVRVDRPESNTYLRLTNGECDSWGHIHTEYINDRIYTNHIRIKPSDIFKYELPQHLFDFD